MTTVAEPVTALDRAIEAAAMGERALVVCTPEVAHEVVERLQASELRRTAPQCWESTIGGGALVLALEDGRIEQVVPVRFDSLHWCGDPARRGAVYDEAEYRLN